MEEKIILVDEKDNEIGAEEKIKTHQEGKLHRAFSIFVFNSQSELLLQRRAEDKYHSGGLWTNTCCSHPREGEELEDAVHRRLQEELGFDCELKEAFSFIYRKEFDNGLTEHELDHVFVGECEAEPNPDPAEVSEWKWITLDGLNKDIKENPDNYTYWLKVALDKVIKYVKG